MESSQVLEVYEGSGSPVDDLAFEAWMLDRAAAGQPCVCATSWTGPVVVLGYAQDPADVDRRGRPANRAERVRAAHGVPPPTWRAMSRRMGPTGV